MDTRANRRLVGTAIPGMAEEACRVFASDGVERGTKRLMQGLGGACGDAAQFSLELGPGGLDGIEVWRVGRQVPVEEARTIEQPAHGLRLVSTEVVEHQHRVRLAAA